MFTNVGSDVRVCEGYNQEFEVTVGVHQSPALYQRAGGIAIRVPLWSSLIIADSMAGYVRRLLILNEAMEERR